MATRNFADMAKLVDTKVSEMEELLNELLNSDVSENTKRTQKFQRQTAIHNLKVLQAILYAEPGSEVKLTEEQDKWFTSMITLTAERKAKIVTVEVHEGDNVMQLAFGKYKDVTDIVAKINKAVDKAGLKIVDGIVTSK